MNAPIPVLKPDTLYIGDNGRCFCGKHAGTSAKFTGRDISGQKVKKLSKAGAAMGIGCEDAGCRETS